MSEKITLVWSRAGKFYFNLIQIAAQVDVHKMMIHPSLVAHHPSPNLQFHVTKTCNLG